MAKDTFFVEKKEWSKTKDKLLGHYLKLYFNKILATRANVKYIDCFAGKGRFDDGEIGSPLMALEIAKEALKISKVHNSIDFCFIEKMYSNDLKDNTQQYKCTIYPGAYETSLHQILESCKYQNVFLYIDPFGIKSLHFDIFSSLKSYSCRSMEMLLNLNSFGFIREGCRVLNAKPLSEEISALEERENDSGSTKNDIPNMNRVANGSYWQKIITDYNSGAIDAFQAEDRFVEEYCNQLRNVFSYVINIPIKVKIQNMPKYRMVFATNHKHGLVEMASNMCKKSSELINGGQMTLFDYSKGDGVKEVIMNFISSADQSYDDILVSFYLEKGPLYSESDINAAIKELEAMNSIVVSRNPPITETGRRATWISYKKDMKVRRGYEKCH
ncbi:hypothetical protein BHU72_14545 [Desulfuribacillus stibiiarsenatis]|uniref:Three-Cys-motif partner protein TcmP n=1 Tax=Desulfuribacillus stibiiarsenatis TaxID=1390249 RepID=A0A1E5L7C2_9FIRM|nr:three-Cys-motif partner protein TcmP [Desulfuribacillus stibiiarsenatis]OEH86047.1 hypothetical protein BHU72_14545 [Desulfuribacillus stibiiarsenatis]